MYRITLVCIGGVPSEEGPQVARDITQEFARDRTWHKNVVCSWRGSQLLLTAENDYDPDGQALIDEFGDCIHAYVRNLGSGRIEVVSIKTV